MEVHCFSLNESGDLTITGKFVSTYASKATSGDILVDDGGEIKKRTPAELKNRFKFKQCTQHRCYKRY